MDDVYLPRDLDSKNSSVIGEEIIRVELIENKIPYVGETKLKLKML